MKIFHGFNIKFIKGDIYGGITAGIIALPLGLAWGAVSGLGGYGVAGTSGSAGYVAPGYPQSVGGGGSGGAVGYAIVGVSNVLANSNTVTGPTS